MFWDLPFSLDETNDLSFQDVSLYQVSCPVKIRNNKNYMQWKLSSLYTFITKIVLRKKRYAKLSCNLKQKKRIKFVLFVQAQLVVFKIVSSLIELCLTLVFLFYKFYFREVSFFYDGEELCELKTLSLLPQLVQLKLNDGDVSK